MNKETAPPSGQKVKVLIESTCLAAAAPILEDKSFQIKGQLFLQTQ